MIGVALLALSLGLATTAAQAEGYPRTVTDSLGRSVTIAAKPARVVPIFASNAEIVAGVGAADRVVGIEAWTRFPPELLDRPRIGGRLGFSVEAIVKLRADLVIVTPARQAANQVLKPLVLVGIPVIVLQHGDVPQVLRNIELIGYALGEEEKAGALLAGMKARLDCVAEALRDRSPRRVYLETGSNDRGGFQSVRDGSYSADILKLAGGVNVFAGPRPIAQASGEALLRADPQVILVAGTTKQAEGVPGRVGWDRLAAVQARQVHSVPRAELLIPGPRVVDGVERLARLLFPDLSGRLP